MLHRTQRRLKFLFNAGYALHGTVCAWKGGGRSRSGWEKRFNIKSGQLMNEYDARMAEIAIEKINRRHPQVD
ncbi:MAG TPA: hypothetical protein VK897_13845 [Anaerolineales bacterium]|nr:hypothetical protein [Anaerolineales bacterium]